MSSKKNLFKIVLILIAIGLILQVGSTFLLNGILDMTGAAEEYATEVGGLFENSPMTIFYVAILAPLLEEVIFRLAFLKGFDFILTKLLKLQTGFMIANVLQALLFGIYHHNLIQGTYAFLIGMLFGYICGLGNVLYSMLIHIVVNISGLVLANVLSIDIATFLKMIIGFIVLLLLVPVLKGLRSTRCCIYSEKRV